MKRARRNVQNAVDDILLLIRTGRTGMAVTVLSGFVAFLDDIHESICEQSYQEGRRDMAAELAGKKRRAAAKRFAAKTREQPAGNVAAKVSDRQLPHVEGSP